MIPDQLIDVKVYNQTVKRWRQNGFDCSVGDTISVPLCMIGRKSHYEIRVICDYCNCEFSSSFAIIKSNRERSGTIDLDCCANCQSKKGRDSNIKKYGVATPAELPEVVEKMRETTLQRYGVENVSQVDVFKSKKIDTSMSNYGVSYYAMTDEFDRRVRETCLKKYGCEYSLQNLDVRAKGIRTCLERYGVPFASMSDEFKARAVKTNLERYGYPNPAMSPEVIKKIALSFEANGNIPTSKPQLKMFNDILDLGYDARLNYLSGHYFYDVALFNGDIKLDIEFDGIYWHQNPDKDEKRDAFSIENGWRVIRFIGGSIAPPIGELKKAIESAIAGETRQVISLIGDGH